MKLNIYIYLSLLLFNINALSSSVTTPIQAVMDGVLFATRNYARDNNGVAPISWSQIKQYLNMTVMDNFAGGSAEKSIVFINSVSFFDNNQDAIFVVTSSPISEDRRDGIGRYTLWRKNGAYRLFWQKEEDVKKQLAIQGVAIPQGAINKQPDVKPESTILDWYGPIQHNKNAAPPANPPPDQIKKITPSAPNSSPSSMAPANDHSVQRDADGAATSESGLVIKTALIFAGLTGILFWIRSRNAKSQ